MVKYCFDRYKTQEMHDKAVDNFLSTHKVFPNWFVTSRMFKNLSNALFADDNILFFDEDSGSVTFSVDEMGILIVYLNNPNHANFYEDDPKTVVYVRRLYWDQRYKKHDAF